MVDVKFSDAGLVLLVDGLPATGEEARALVTPEQIEQLVKKAGEFNSPYAATYAIGVRLLLTGE